MLHIFMDNEVRENYMKELRLIVTAEKKTVLTKLLKFDIM